MGTQLFLLDATADGNDNDANTIDKGLSPTRGASVAFTLTDTVAGPTPGVPMTIGSGDFQVIWLSSQLQGVTITGNITFNFRMRESIATANVGAQAKLFRCDANGNVISQIINSERGVEMGTVLYNANNWSAAPTPTTLQTGDRLKLVLFGNDAGGNMASGATFGMSYNGATTGITGDSYIQLTETVQVMVPAHLLPSLGAGN